MSARPLPAIASSRSEPVWTIDRVPAWTITAVLGVLYLIIAPQSADLAAATYRSNLFGRVGFTLWDNGWYGGHHLPAYSLLAPALGWLIGPALLAALSMTLAAALFAALIEGHFPARAARIAAVWFAFGAGVSLLAGRVPFDLGLAVGLGALVAAQRNRRAPALVLALACPLASPVAGGFLALATLAWAMAGHFGPIRRRAGPRGPFLARADASHGPRSARIAYSRTLPVLMTLATLTPIAALELAFPEGGTQPFVPSAFYPGLAGVLAIAVLIGVEQRVLKVGTLLYAAALHRRVRDPHRRRCQRRPARRARRRTAGCVCAADRSALRRGMLPRARPLPALLADQRPAVGLRLGHLEPIRAGLLLRAPAG